MIIFVTGGEKRSAYQVDTTAPEVSWIISDLLAKSFQLPYPPDHYVLMYPESGEYLNNQNLMLYLRENVELVLKLGPAIEAAEAVSSLRSNDDVKKKKTIFSLQKQFQDSEFALEFVKKSGIDVISDLLNKSSGNTLAYALNALQTLMNKQVGWTNLSKEFIAKIAEFSMNPTLNICRPAAAILIQLVRAGPNSTGPIKNYGFSVVHEAMKAQNAYSKIVERINESDVETQTNSLTLINSLFEGAEGQEQSELMERLDSLNARKTMMRQMQSTSSAEVSRGIINFQVTYHSYLAWKKNIPVSQSKPDHARLLKEILEAADVKDVEKIGFKSNNVEAEMSQVGYLGLENMNYFARKNKDFFSKYILEQNSRTDGKSCPFAVASMETTKILLDHCRIRTDLDEKASVLLGFEEIHTFTLQSLFKLWVEMQASSADMPKVVTLMRTHLDFVRKKEFSFDQYKIGVGAISYVDLQKKQLQNMEAGDNLLTTIPVRNLRDRIFKDSTEFMKSQLFHVLQSGAFFQNYGPKGRMKGYRFYKLAPNKRYMHYGEFPEITSSVPSLDSLQEKIDLTTCSEVVVGQLCPLFAGKKGRQEDVNLAFSLMLKDSEASAMDAVADNANQYSEWTDGLRLALGKPLTKNITSEATMNFISSITDLEIKMRLLEIRAENVQIPNDPPEIPPPPPNFNLNFA